LIFVIAPPLLRPAFGAGSAVGSTHWKQPCGVAIEPFGHIRAPAAPRLRRRLRPALCVGSSPFLRCPPSFAPLSSLRSSITPLRYGAPLRGAPQLCASVRLYGSARSGTFVGSRSLRSLALVRFALSPPQLRPCSRLLYQCKNNYPTPWVRFPPTPAFPLGKGRSSSVTLGAWSLALIKAFLRLIYKRHRLNLTNVSKIQILYSCGESKKARCACFTFFCHPVN
jgi:hypothetical protein